MTKVIERHWMNSRKIFIETLSALARKDPTVILLVMDVGFSYVEDFGKEFPDQYINLGVTEQSATGIAAGMALSGMKPYLYSMIPFVTMRNYEQVRNDICYHNANVKLIGVQGSVHYKFLGFSHNMIGDEDEKILTGLPNLTRMYPQTEEEVKFDILASYESEIATYIRL